jgi:hypothetical protein
MSGPLSDDALEQLERWSSKARELFTELLDDAPSDLQRELLQRAVTAKHTPAEVHAFADAIRGLDDDQVYAACTLEEAAPHDYTVGQLLRAEADPLFAYELRGGALDPGDDAPAPPTVELELSAPPRLDPLIAPPRRKGAFEADSRDVAPQPVARKAAPPPPAPSAPGRAAAQLDATPLAEDLLAEATRGLAVSWREHDVDAPGGLSVSEAINAAADALGRGLPVPCVIGPAPGAHRRFIVLLQLSQSGRTRAFQLYDPTSREVCWANEGDLELGRELPFVNKVNRRLTRVALPSSLR